MRLVFLYTVDWLGPLIITAVMPDSKLCGRLARPENHDGCRVCHHVSSRSVICSAANGRPVLMQAVGHHAVPRSAYSPPLRLLETRDSLVQLQCKALISEV
jgi:hypothetical protein